MDANLALDLLFTFDISQIEIIINTAQAAQKDSHPQELVANIQENLEKPQEN